MRAKVLPFLVAAAVLAAAVGDAWAGCRGSRSSTRFRYRQTTTIRTSGGGCSCSSANVSADSTSAIAAAPVPLPVNGASQLGGGATEALGEVNAARAARGLPAYVRDDGLTQAAMTIAVQRATSRNAGHTANDFSGLPAGSTAAASGCAAWPPGLGWGSCATYDRYTYAGAAWALGGDGRRYMQLFVR